MLTILKTTVFLGRRYLVGKILSKIAIRNKVVVIIRIKKPFNQIYIDDTSRTTKTLLQKSKVSLFLKLRLRCDVFTFTLRTYKYFLTLLGVQPNYVSTDMNLVLAYKFIKSSFVNLY